VLVLKVTDAVHDHCRWTLLTPLPQEPPRTANIRIFLECRKLETRIIGLHFAADSINLVSFKFFWWAP